MRYPEFRRQHVFVGSGVIEAGCKTVIGSRLKRSGMFWTVSGANALWHLADEACGVVDAARAFVFRHLRIRAKRTRPVHSAAGDVRRDDLFRRHTAFPPALHYRHLVELIGTRAGDMVSRGASATDAQPDSSKFFLYIPSYSSESYKWSFRITIGLKPVVLAS